MAGPNDTADSLQRDEQTAQLTGNQLLLHFLERRRRLQQTVSRSGHEQQHPVTEGTGAAEHGNSATVLSVNSISSDSMQDDGARVAATDLCSGLHPD